jgi:hypothetical protein
MRCSVKVSLIMSKNGREVTDLANKQVRARRVDHWVHRRKLVGGCVLRGGNTVAKVARLDGVAAVADRSGLRMHLSEAGDCSRT